MGRNDEREIFEGILNGNELILKEFYNKNFESIHNYVVYNSGTENDSEDLFQDALVILFERLRKGTLQISCSIHTYFYSICKNIWRSKLRKKNKVSCCGKIDTMLLEAHAQHIDDTIEAQEREQLYRKHFDRLNCKCKRILALFFEGKSMEEIGALTDYSTGYVRKKKFECKKHLIQMIEQDPSFSELLFLPKKNQRKKNIG